MKFYYENTDMETYANVISCIYTDQCGDKCSMAEMEIENAETWYRWGPKKDDEIRLTMDGLDSGRLYLNTILPSDGKYRIIASSLPGTAYQKANKTYRGITLEGLAEQCAAECGMTESLYGLDGKIKYDFLLRDDMSAPAFLRSILRYEGATLEIWDKTLAAIGIEKAQKENAIRTIELSAMQDGVQHINEENGKLKRLTIYSPYGRATAEDTSITSGTEKMIYAPANGQIEAARWARGLMIHHNRETEETNISMAFDPQMSVMMRVDIRSNTGTNGQWIIDRARHDLINKTSDIKLYRVTDGIR